MKTPKVAALVFVLALLAACESPVHAPLNEFFARQTVELSLGTVNGTGIWTGPDGVIYVDTDALGAPETIELFFPLINNRGIELPYITLGPDCSTSLSGTGIIERVIIGSNNSFLTITIMGTTIKGNTLTVHITLVNYEDKHILYQGDIVVVYV